MSKPLFFILFCTLFLPLAPAQDWGVFLKDGQDEVIVPFEVRSNLILIPLRINGGPPLKFIFDTGAEHVILLEKQLVPVLGMSLTREVKVTGADLQNEVRAFLSPNVRLSLTNVEARRQNILVLDRNTLHLEELLGENVHGILGASLFRNFVMEIDYKRRHLILSQNKTYRLPSKKFEEVDIDMVSQRPFVRLDMTTATGDTLRDLRFLIDTGGGLTLLVSTNTHPALRVPEQTIVTSVGAGLSGLVTGFVGRTSWIQLGPFEFQQVVTSFQEAPDSTYRSHSVKRNGLVGNAILNRFDVVLDYVGEKMYLKPRRKWKEKFEYDKSGLSLIAGGPHLDDYYINQVVPGSPADRAGLRRGDRILGINGWTAGWYSLSTISRKLRKKVGKKIKLKVLRDGEKLTFTFHLEKLI